LFLADYYARPSKRGGAWMSSYVSQSGLLGTKPVVANHLNIPKPPAGEPTLLTFDEVTHAVSRIRPRPARHVLAREVSALQRHRRAARLRRVPSQVNEMWAVWPEVLKNYAKHYQTGEPMPPALLEKMLATQEIQPGLHDHRVPRRRAARPWPGTS
jgi:peptidyl-dipeptidase Dcp